jgi:hypothetical protein
VSKEKPFTEEKSCFARKTAGVYRKPELAATKNGVIFVNGKKDSKIPKFKNSRND